MRRKGKKRKRERKMSKEGRKRKREGQQVRKWRKGRDKGRDREGKKMGSGYKSSKRMKRK